MELTVDGDAGELTLRDLSPSCSIRDVHEELQRRSGVPVKQQLLTFSGAVLGPSKTLGELDCSPLHLTSFAQLVKLSPLRLPATEQRGIQLSQLEALIRFLAERSCPSGLVPWRDRWGSRIFLKDLNLYHLADWVICPSTAEDKCSYVELIASDAEVEPPGTGDGIRTWRLCEDQTGNSLWWQSIARNKRSLALDLRSPKGRALLRRLICQVDVLVENFKPGTLEKWGMSPESLRKDNPGLVVARVSGYGQTGPKSSEPGFASVCEGVGGFRFVNGVPGEPPVRPNLSIGDTLAGMNAVLGILLALLKRGQLSGGVAFSLGQDVDSSIAESVFGLLEACVPEYDYAGAIRQPSGSSLTGIVPTGTYPCKDGTFMIIGANGDSLFKRLMAVMGRSDLAEDKRFEDNAGRCRHQDVLDEAIIEWTRSKDAAEVQAACKEAAVPCGPIFSIKDIMEDEHFRARGCFEDVHLPDGRSVKVPAIGPKLSATPGNTSGGGPQLGQHTTEVLREKLRLSDDELSTLRSEGVIAGS